MNGSALYCISFSEDDVLEIKYMLINFSFSFFIIFPFMMINQFQLFFYYYYFSLYDDILLAMKSYQSFYWF